MAVGHLRISIGNFKHQMRILSRQQAFINLSDLGFGTVLFFQGLGQIENRWVQPPAMTDWHAISVSCQHHAWDAVVFQALHCKSPATLDDLDSSSSHALILSHALEKHLTELQDGLQTRLIRMSVPEGCQRKCGPPRAAWAFLVGTGGI